MKSVKQEEKLINQWHFDKNHIDPSEVSCCSTTRFGGYVINADMNGSQHQEVEIEARDYVHHARSQPV